MGRSITSRALTKAYLPVYLSLMITGVLLLVLFLRPGSVASFQVDVNSQKAPAKSGVPVAYKKEVTPGGPAERVVLLGSLVFRHAEIALIKEVKAQLTDPNGTVIADISLPIVDEDTEDVEFILTDGSGTFLGAIQVDVAVGVDKVTLVTGGGYAYAYGYFAPSAGSIVYTLTYVPPDQPVTGDYNMLITATFDDDSTTQDELPFRILGLFSVSALDTLYPRGEDGAIGGDMVVLQAKVSTEDTGVASLLLESINRVWVDGAFPLPETAPTHAFVEVAKVHPSLRQKWGVSSEASFVLPIMLPGDSVAGNFDLPVTATDIASNMAVDNGAPLLVEAVRDELNVYLNPGVNFLTPGIQCAPSGDARCSGTEFDIDSLLTQPVTNAATGFSTLAHVIRNIFWYCPVSGGGPPEGLCTAAQEGTFLTYTPGTAGPHFSTLKAGLGYIVTTKPAAFLTNDHPAQGMVGTPVPIKMTFEGAVVQDTSNKVLGSTRVLQAWNLIGPWAQQSTTVGRFLKGAEVPTPIWVALHTFTNSLDIKMGTAGTPVLDSQGQPFAELVDGSFSTAVYGLDPDKVVPLGSGSWLFVCLPPTTGPADACEDGANLPPVLE